MRWTIGQRIGAGFFVTIMLVFLMIICSFYSLRQISSGVEKALDCDVAITVAANSVERDLLESRRSEKDFLMRLDQKYVARVAKKIEALKANAASMSSILKELNDGESLAKVEKVQKGADTYLAAFNSLAKCQVKRGLTPNKGCQGTFRGAAHAFEQAVQKLDVEWYRVGLLTLRRHEKDFILRGEDKYIKRHGKVASDLEKRLLASKLSKEDKDTLMRSHKTYTSGFAKFVEVQRAIGSSIQEGRSFVHELEAILKDVKNESLIVSMLQMRRHEKDYLMRGKEKYIKRHAKEANSFRRVFESDQGLTAADKEIISRKVESYIACFAKAVEASKRKGTKSTGIYGAFRKASHDVEKCLNGMFVERAMENYLMLRRHEKDYIARLNTKYIKRAKKLIAVLQDSVKSSKLSKERKTSLSKNISDYEKAFLSLRQIDLEIAANIKAFRDAAHAIQPIVQDLAKVGKDYLQESRQSVSTTMANIEKFMYLVGSLILIGGLALSFFITKAITNALTRVVAGLRAGSERVLVA